MDAGKTDSDYTVWQGAYKYDLRKLRGKDLVVKPGRARHYHTPCSRRHRRLLILRDQVIGHILTGVGSSRLGRKPITWTRVDRDYETYAST